MKRLIYKFFFHASFNIKKSLKIYINQFILTGFKKTIYTIIYSLRRKKKEKDDKSFKF